jgi:hypothetical protein
MADTLLLCPSCTKTWPTGTKFCANCSTSLHHAKVYVALDDIPALQQSTQSASVQLSPVIKDEGLDRIRANNYYALRARATTLELIGYIQFFLGVAAGIGAVIAIIVAIFSGATSVAGGTVTDAMTKQIFGMAGYIIGVVLLVVGYRLVMSSYATFIQRDELLMRIDVAMNTALIASQVTQMKSRMRDGA